MQNHRHYSEFCILLLQISDALRFSKIVLKHGTDAEILSLKHLIQSKLNRMVNQKSSTTFIAAVETAIRNASWKLLKEQLTQKKQSKGLTLPEVNEGFESNDEDGMMFELTSRII